MLGLGNHSNRLKDAASAYLLQHAHNPVGWQPWDKQALTGARQRNVPILLSIGYAACHWCHVMERECFENEEIAQCMNAHFVCIKVDREERPDIDHLYMDAVQAMGLSAGWPLNVFLMPDTKPFYGGTYFPPQDWLHLLEQITKAFTQQYDKLAGSAAGFCEMLHTPALTHYDIKKPKLTFDRMLIRKSVEQLSPTFDHQWGGLDRVPKFPMPCMYEMLLAYSYFEEVDAVKNHVLFTLRKIGQGGIYDQIDGGFARYSVDGQWFVPHFEKMLYDNAQLIALYAHAFSLTQAPFYKKIIGETIAFLNRVFKGKNGGYYATLDADTQGVEGKFYTWSTALLKNIIPTADWELFANYYAIEVQGNWEKTNILFRKTDDNTFASKYVLPTTELKKKVDHWKNLLDLARNKRPRPNLDKKQLTTWNALTLTALSEAHLKLQQPEMLDFATKLATFIENELFEDDRLLHQPLNNNKPIYAFLDDYATTIAAYLQYFQLTFEIKYLEKAKRLAQRAITLFYDEADGLFFYQSAEHEKLLAKKKELFDNVIPSSNAIMASNLWKLSSYYADEYFETLAKTAVLKMANLFEKDLAYLSNWAKVYMRMVFGNIQVVIIGMNFYELARELQAYYLPNCLFFAAPAETAHPLTHHRFCQGHTYIYVCRDSRCLLPVETVAAALAQINKNI